MSVADTLDEGNGSVGTKLELEHTAPTPVGMTVTCESELVAVEGRKLTFKVALHDEKRPCRRRHPRTFCHQQRQVRSQGGGEEGLKGKRARPLSVTFGASLPRGEPLAKLGTLPYCQRLPL